MKKILLFLVFWGSGQLYARVDRAYDYVNKARSNPINNLYAAQELLDAGYYYSAIPLVKEYLVTARKINSYKLDLMLERLTKVVGIKQFEVLPMKVLQRSKAPTIRYIIAKKLFKRRKYKQVLQFLNASIPRNHQIKPFALNLEATTYNFLGKKEAAVETFKECISRSESMMGGDSLKDRQLEINRDFCIVGIGRVYFNFHEYKKAESAYLDLKKNSYIWPEILYEEAWNSFYLQNYNRTLGKLVTYKAPLLTFLYKPEIEVLNALTYFELCMWNDVSKTVDRFYLHYGNAYQQIERFLQRHGRDYRYYYLLANTKKSGSRRGSKTINRMLDTIVRDPVFLELYESYQRAKQELVRSDKESRRMQYFIQQQLRNSLLLERNLIGGYVRSSLIDLKNSLQEALEGMSSIKLEILKRKKQALYQNSEMQGNGKRGNIKNLERTDKQYFWDFNGEFWADELGDYVFSLKTRCK